MKKITELKYYSSFYIIDLHTFQKFQNIKSSSKTSSKTGLNQNKIFPEMLNFCS